MPKFIVELELELDGYETEEEMEDACIKFIHQQLTFTSSSVTVTKFEE